MAGEALGLFKRAEWDRLPSKEMPRRIKR
jgi:hypothetical protein